MGEEEEEEEEQRRPGEIRFGGMSFALPPPGDQDHDGGENESEEEGGSRQDLCLTTSVLEIFNR